MDLITFIDYTGTLVFAISGVLAGVDRKFDLFGVFILGFVTEFGIPKTKIKWYNYEHH